LALTRLEKVLRLFSWHQLKVFILTVIDLEIKQCDSYPVRILISSSSRKSILWELEDWNLNTHVLKRKLGG
jgi:hypothetical protein